MISHRVYELIHIVGILFLFSALGALALHAAGGGTKESNRTYRVAMIAHGVALFLILLGGFGMLARIGMSHGALSAGWVWVKLIIWGALGAAIVLPYRRPEWARTLFFLAPLLGVVAAAMALYKPF